MGRTPERPASEVRATPWRGKMSKQRRYEKKALCRSVRDLGTLLGGGVFAGCRPTGPLPAPSGVAREHPPFLGEDGLPKLGPPCDSPSPKASSSSLWATLW